MLVSVIIINYNTFTLTCNCIQSIIEHTSGVPYEIILVDNASTKDDPKDFLTRFPGIRLIINPENNGFAKGNNLGIRHANGDMILLLNSDTILLEDSISEAASYVEAKPDIGFLTVRLVYEDMTYQHNARKFRSIKNELLDICRPYLALLPYRKRAALMLNQFFKGDFDTECDWVSGALMLARKSVISALPGGQLDERFFMYGEDQLWCYQAIEAGYKNYFLHGTSVIHIANASTSPAKQLALSKKMIAHELEIMRYRKGRSLYYYTFYCIYTFKEFMRYAIKVIALNLFKYKIR